MDKILSQDEINALFSAISTDDVALAAAPDKQDKDGRKIDGYDFQRADRISQDQIRSLHTLHDYFGRNFSSSLSAYLRAFVDVSIRSVDQLLYTEFLKLVPDPTLFATLGMRPLDSYLALEINPSIVLPVIDMLLGGPGNPPAATDRTLTEIEMNIIEGVIRLAMRDLRDAWRPIMEVDFYLENSGTKPQGFQIVAPGETVVVVALEVKLGEASGMMNLCIPSRVLKVLRSRFDQQWNYRRQKVAGGDAERILTVLKPAPIALSGELHDNTLTVDDLLKISEGDIIQLNRRINDATMLCVAGVPKFAGRIIARQGKKFFEITRDLSK
jgi:flagellar motor switch protein FliM